MKTFPESTKNFHHTENSFQDYHFKTKEVAEATSFSHLPSGTLPFPSVLTPSHHYRANHTSHHTQNPRHQIIRQLREKRIQTQREKYSGKKISAHHKSLNRKSLNHSTLK